ncbi:MAG: nucleoside recognition domain-containing protein, partial [Bacilli bacterium]
MFGIGNADIITLSMYLLGMVTAIVTIIIMRNTTMKGEVPPFIMELPAYHAPQFKSLMLHLWDKAKHFIKKAFTIILASTILIWFVSHFSWNWSYLPDEQMASSILASIGQLIQPIFTPLGFGIQLGTWGWIFVVAAITGLIAKENVIATFGVLAATIVAGFEGGEEGIEAVSVMIQATSITIPALIAFIAFNMTTIPCFAAVATAKAELPSKKYRSTLLFWVVTSYIVASMVYLIGSWPWTIAIFALLILLTIVIITALNKKQRNCNI